MTKNKQPTGARPATKHGETFFQVLFSWPNVLIVVIIGLIALVALVYAEENWRGQWMWNKYRKGLEARGEDLDFKNFIPPTVGNDENFAATPLIRSLFPKNGWRPWESNYTLAAKMIPSQSTNRNKGERSFLDLVAWEMAFNAVQSDPETKSTKKFQSDKLDRQSRAGAAPSVLKGLECSAEVFEELREASRRLYSRYPITYDLAYPWGIPLPHLSFVRQISRQLQLKACAELAHGQSGKALEDTKFLFHMADSLKGEPFLISHLVGIECLQIAIQPVWEGLVEHRWSDGQLQELEKHFLKYDFVTELKRVLRAEQAGSILVIDQVRQDRNLSELLDMVSSERASLFDSAFVQVFARIMPSGWYYQEQLDFCRLFQGQFRDVLSATNQTVSPSQTKSRALALEKALGGNGAIHSLAAKILLSDLGKRVLQFAKAQVAVDEAGIACALERYWMATGRFPETTEELVPRFLSRLPKDVLTGTAYKYRREKSAFILYSLGWNEKDDHGVPGKTYFDHTEGDWVWQSASN